MKVVSYMNQSLFSVIIPASADLSSVPREVVDMLGSNYKMKELDLKPGEARVALSSDEAIADIERQGYHTVQAKITSTIS
ncbi:hypothetical protein KVG88_19160 [Pseudomonas sp. SWRI74]|uniref:HMA domain-containing protein n=1 Tax=Pseudomonas azerbaijanoccidentalis TaxID=2842347 RepID=A0ABS6QTE2_9PSED|nr:hypothetical protein [Pseudomonas azerbaijanoccidentalis]MBV4522183.1 hypothetical protein [Pseudomonas azerbaijanoccidentalis]